VYLGQGDPLTPGFPSTAEALRLTLEEANDAGQNGTQQGWRLPPIPSIPVSAADITPIMAAMGRTGIPAASYVSQQQRSHCACTAAADVV
jgi:hypothetical protein